MAKLIEYKDMSPRAKAVVEGIAQARGIDPADINNVWKALARHPSVMKRFAAEMKAVFAPDKLPPPPPLRPPPPPRVGAAARGFRVTRTQPLAPRQYSLLPRRRSSDAVCGL